MSEARARTLLFLGAEAWGTDSRALAAALRRLGHHLVVEDYENYYPLCWNGFILRAARKILRTHCVRAYNEAVARHAENPGLDAVLVFKGMLLEAQVVKRFKDQGVQVLCFYPDVSFEDHGPNIPACLPLYDAIFTTKSFHMDDAQLKTLGPDWHFVPHGYDPDVHRPIELGDATAEAYRADVSFIGCWSPKKEAYLDAIIQACPDVRIRIWGPAWERAKSRVKSCWEGRGAYGDELVLIYRASAINLALLSEAGQGSTQGDQTTARTWQIPACGAFMLHESTPEFLRFFKADEESGVFQDATDLPAKVQRYLGDPERRTRIAEAGNQRAHTEGYAYDRAAKVVHQYLVGQA